MLFVNVVKEYREVKEMLLKGEPFFTQSKILISDFNQNVFQNSMNYFASVSNKSQSDSNDQLRKGINDIFDSVFANTLTLNSKIPSLIESVTLLRNNETINACLGDDVGDLINNANDSIENIYKIIEMQAISAKKSEFFNKMVNSLQRYSALYSSIYSTCIHYEYSLNLVYGAIGEMASTDDYVTLSIQSLTTSNDLMQVSNSIGMFGDMCEKVIRLCEKPISERYHIRKVETGSLLIEIVGSVATITIILKFVDFCIMKYIEYRKAGLDIKSMRQQIVKGEIELADKLLELIPDLENKKEIIEKASSSAFEYFKMNPKFTINGKEYDAEESTPLIAIKESDNSDDSTTKCESNEVE